MMVSILMPQATAVKLAQLGGKGDSPLRGKMSATLTKRLGIL
ncbi:MAG: hypothetical protein Q4D37_03190 [Oscillospiraceae bacterium]|nr:hypothetical protein [Oscillospiraceae bacterium]